MHFDLAKLKEKIHEVVPVKISGQVSQVVGLLVECEGLSVPVGALCHIEARDAGETMEAEVIGFKNDRALLMPFGDVRGIARFDKVRLVQQVRRIPVGPALLGRILDGRGRPIDGKGEVGAFDSYPVFARAPEALSRKRVTEPLSTGVKAIDGLFTIGKGQRVGLFSGSGVGKSMLMGMIARNSSADVSVIGLVGERGRELKDFIEKDLGAEGLKRSVVVVATSDKPHLERIQCAFVATAVAEYFRDQGKDVVLMMDSVTRVCLSQREVGLSMNEPPATKGYPPSVFALLPRLLERSGQSSKGSITGFYTVLVEGDDTADPIADSVRGILDGHIWLSRKIANRGRYPAIDVLESISRCMIDVSTKPHQQAAMKVKELLATYLDAEDLINIGAYAQGSNRNIDKAIQMYEPITEFLKQWYYEAFDLSTTIQLLLKMFPEIAQANERDSLVKTIEVQKKAGAPSAANQPAKAAPQPARARRK
ncbi:MAG: FliI/YscN family ATPase [Planctomycetes bacterium]|nr:FliI/YscN family ATPase [Planctomycetota bacterium]